jgi:hypothetical protein
MKKPENKLSKRWKDGVNAGRSARDVAEELALEKATGIKKVFHDYFPAAADDDDEGLEQEPVIPLADDFMEALTCRFKQAKINAAPIVEDWEDALEEDADHLAAGNAEDMRSLAQDFAGGARRGNGQATAMDWQPARSVNDGQAGPYREGAFNSTAFRARPEQAAPPAYNAQGYRAHVPQKKPAQEEESDDDNDNSDEGPKKPKRKIKKAKIDYSKVKVKQEEQNGWK